MPLSPGGKREVQRATAKALRGMKPRAPLGSGMAGKTREQVEKKRHSRLDDILKRDAD